MAIDPEQTRLDYWIEHWKTVFRSDNFAIHGRAFADVDPLDVAAVRKAARVAADAQGLAIQVGTTNIQPTPGIDRVWIHPIHEPRGTPAQAAIRQQLDEEAAAAFAAASLDHPAVLTQN